MRKVWHIVLAALLALLGGGLAGTVSARLDAEHTFGQLEEAVTRIDDRTDRIEGRVDALYFHFLEGD